MSDFSPTKTPAVKQANYKTPSHIYINRSPNGFADSSVELDFNFGVQLPDQIDPITKDPNMQVYQQRTIIQGKFGDLLTKWQSAIGTNGITSDRINAIIARIIQMNIDLTQLAEDVAQLHVDAGGAEWPTSAHITE